MLMHTYTNDPGYLLAASIRGHVYGDQKMERERKTGGERGVTGVLLSTGDNRRLRARLVQLLLFLSGYVGGGAGDPLYLEDM